MRRYMASLAVLTFVLFALGVMAQTSGSYGQSNPPSAGSSSNQNQNTSTTTTSTTTSQTTANPQQANLEGCVVREQADYFLVPRSGSPIKLQASTGQDFSSQVGQRVQVTGNESSLSAAAGTGTSGQMGAGTSGAAPGTSASAGTSGGMAGATGTAGTGNQTGTGATGAIGAPGSTTGAAGSSGMATSSDLHSMANQQVNVSNISPVGSCPPNWNPSVPQNSGQSR